jgi:hypothetical protein
VEFAPEGKGLYSIKGCVSSRLIRVIQLAEVRIRVGRGGCRRLRLCGRRYRIGGMYSRWYKEALGGHSGLEVERGVEENLAGGLYVQG